MSQTPLSEAQSNLRTACQTGDIQLFQSALIPQPRTWKRTLWRWFRGLVQETTDAPASLDYVYDDDHCNLAVHYIASGAPSSRLQSLLSGCLPVSRQNTPTGNYDTERAALVDWLSKYKHSLDVAAINADLNTPTHCASQSNSPATLKALLVTAAGTEALTSGCLSLKNAQEDQPLDIALQNRQWHATQLLVAAGALQGSPAYAAAKGRLQEAMPQQPSMTQPALSSLVSGVGKFLSALLGPTSQQTSHSPLQTIHQPQHQPPHYPLQTQLDPKNSQIAWAHQAHVQSVDWEADTAVPYSQHQGLAEQPASVFLQDEHTILLHRAAALEYVQQQCNVDKSIAALLLFNHQGNLDAACNAWQENSTGALQSCGVAQQVAKQMLDPASITASSGINGYQQCLVCFEDVQPSALAVHLPCGHCTCNECWQGILAAALEDGSMTKACCPDPNCHLPINLGQAESLLSHSATARLRQLAAQHHVNTNPLIQWCPSPQCSGAIAFQPRNADPKSSMAEAIAAGRAVDVVCCCGQAFCFACSANAHEPATCQQAEQWTGILAKMRQEDKESAQQWVTHHTQPCPGCGSRIQKNGGCNHMSCSVCRRQFCWICGGDWAKHNAETGGYFRCNVALAPEEEAAAEANDSPAGQVGNADSARAGTGAGAGAGPNAASAPLPGSLREKAKRDDIMPDIAHSPKGLQQKIKAGHAEKQPDVEEGGVTAQTQQKDVFYKIHPNPVGIFLFSCFMATYLFYFYVRIRYTLFGGYFGYSLFILIVEFAASTNMILYGLLLLRRKEYIDHPITRRFHVRVLIPCYSESLEIVSATALAARRAALPAGVRRTVYILDDGKDPDKKTWVESLKDPDMLYTPGHIKTGPEINGKACNLNSTLRALFPAGTDIGLEELIVVFDADMVCSTEFFVKTLPRIVDDRVSLVLTPQAYHNYDPATDIFNHSAFAYWSMLVPGEDAWGHIVCTGSNFVMRTKHCQEAGWFPTYTMCEDFALALELQAKKYKAAYVQEFLAVGEVPVTVRGTFQQRSRWCKGGMQIWFSRRNWWLRRDIPVLQKFLWSISCWGYITQSFATPVFLAIPIVGVWFRIFPIDNTFWFALAFTLYFPMMNIMAYYCHDYPTFRSFWFATINSNNMWYCFLKAWCNVVVSKFTKKQSGFKVTAKSTMSTTAKMTPKAKIARTTSQTLIKQGRKLDLENYCAPGVRDLWMPMLIFALNLATIFLGIYRLDKESVPSELMTFNMAVSVLWAAYNSIPPLLLLHFAFAGYKGMRWNVRICGVAASLILLGVLICVWLLLPPTFDFGQALQHSMSFFDAEKSGTLTANDIAWRGNSALSDATANGSSLVGGFYDGANGYVKYGYPIATATMLLAWGMLEFPKGYAEVGQTTRALNTIRTGADYITSCSVSDSEFVVQVGNYALDLVDLNSPEQMTQARPVYMVNATSPGSDLVAASAAALAVSSMVFNSSDSAYSAKLLTTAESLYGFASAYEGLVSDSVPQVSYAYLSTSYLDDLAFAAAWLHKATGNSTYLTSAMTYKARSLNEEADAARNYNVFNYQNSLPGVNLLLAQATNFATNEYTLATKGFMIVWMSGKYTIKYTPKLLAYSPDNPLRNAANAGLIAVIYAKHEAKKYNCWATSQARYVLGSGGRSFMVGYRHKYPTRSLDKVARCNGNSCLDTSSNAANPHLNYGAVVNGPNYYDTYKDNRTAPGTAGVHLENNAGLSGLLSAMKELNLNWAECTAGVNFVKMSVIGRPV